MTKTDRFGEVERVTTYKHDSEGRELEQRYTLNKKEYLHTTTYKNGAVQFVSTPHQDTYYTYDYTNLRERAVIKDKSSDSRRIDTRQYLHEIKGRDERSVKLEFEGKASFFRTEYKFDATGNWISKVRYLDDKPFQFEERIITYY